jgi:hypothetical protein
MVAPGAPPREAVVDSVWDASIQKMPLVAATNSPVRTAGSSVKQRAIAATLSRTGVRLRPREGYPQASNSRAPAMKGSHTRRFLLLKPVPKSGPSSRWLRRADTGGRKAPFDMRPGSPVTMTDTPSQIEWAEQIRKADRTGQGANPPRDRDPGVERSGAPDDQPGSSVSGNQGTKRSAAAGKRDLITSMDKRLAKRHKRQVARAGERLRVSEPDVRTPDQRKAAREASLPGGVRGSRSPAYHAMPPGKAKVEGV